MAKDPARRTPRRRDRIRALLALGLALGLGSITTMAQLTSSAEVTPGSLQAAQLDVLIYNTQLAGSSNLDATYVENGWKMARLLPGEVIALQVTATNGGVSQVPLDLRVDAYGEGVLGPKLQVEFFENGTASNSGVPLVNVGWNTYRKTSNCGAGTSVFPATSLGNGKANAIHPISTKQRLNVGESKSYCVLISLPHTATIWNDTSLLFASGTVVFVMRGTQVGAP